MTKFEKRFLGLIEDNLNYLAIVVVVLLSLFLRFAVRDFELPDMTVYLLPWYEAIKENGGIFSGLAKPIYASNGAICNYSLTYQAILAILGYIPIKPMYAIKAFSCVFDYALAIAIGYFVKSISKEYADVKGITAFAIVLIHPLVFINSASWGQSDAIYTFWCILSLILLLKEKWAWTFICYGIAFAFKFQAVFFLPFMLFYYFYKKKYSVLYYLIIPVIMIILSVPAYMQGRSIIETFSIYGANVGLYQSIAMGYPTFWRVLSDGLHSEGYYTLSIPAKCATIIILGLIMLWWIKRKIELNRDKTIYAAFLLTYTTVLFLPCMHERYGFLYEVLGLIIVFMNKKTIIPYICMVIVSLMAYGRGIYYSEFPEAALGLANTAVYVMYMIMLNKELFDKKSE